MKLCMLLIILNPIAVLVVNGECIWYDKCGDDPEFNDGAHELNCIYKGPGSTYSRLSLIFLKASGHAEKVIALKNRP